MPLANPAMSPSGNNALMTTAQSASFLAQIGANFGVSVSKYGAAPGNTGAANVAGITAALAAAVNGLVFFPPGIYEINDDVLFNGYSDLTLIGYGVTIKGGNTRLAAYFNMSGSERINFYGFTFDMIGPAVLPVYTQADFQTNYNCALLYDGSSWEGGRVIDCTFTNLYTAAIYCYQGSSLHVEGCRFTSPVQNQTYFGTPGAQQLSYMYLQTLGGTVVIRDNSFISAPITNPAIGVNGIFVSGFAGGSSENCSLLIEDNRFDYCSRDNTGSHRLGVIDFYGDVINATVRNNIATNTMAQFMRLSSCKDTTAYGNIVDVNQNAEFDYSGMSLESTEPFGGQKGTVNVSVYDNSFTDPYGRWYAAIQIGAYDWGLPSKNVRVERNNFNGVRNSVFVFGPYDGLFIVENSVRSIPATSPNGTGAMTVAKTAGGVVITSIVGTEANSLFDNLLIASNQIVNGTTALQIPLTISFNDSALTAKLGTFTIVNNTFIITTAQNVIGPTFQFAGTNLSSNRLFYRDNFVQNYQYSLYLREGNYQFIERNTGTGWTTAPILNDLSATVQSFEGNRWANGVLSGTFSLAVGSATIVAPECRTGDKLFITASNGSATTEPVTLAINNGVGFTATSVSPTDATSYYWQLVH
jgi:hypothetical protein